MYHLVKNTNHIESVTRPVKTSSYHKQNLQQAYSLNQAALARCSLSQTTLDRHIALARHTANFTILLSLLTRATPQRGRCEFTDCNQHYSIENVCSYTYGKVSISITIYEIFEICMMILTLTFKMSMSNLYTNLKTIHDFPFDGINPMAVEFIYRHLPNALGQLIGQPQSKIRIHEKTKMMKSQ